MILLLRFIKRESKIYRFSNIELCILETTLTWQLTSYSFNILLDSVLLLIKGILYILISKRGWR